MTTTSTIEAEPAAAGTARGRLGRQRSSRGRARRWLWAALLFSSLVGVIGASVLTVPYYALSPGSTWPLDSLVHVDGAPSYRTRHPVAFTTVNVGQTSLLEALAGWIDGDVDVVPASVIDGDRSRDETNSYNRRLMDDSKLVAKAVALRAVGRPVELRTAGTQVVAVAEGQPASGKLSAGDVIVAVDGAAVDVPDELRTLLAVGGPGATHRLSVAPSRGGGVREVELATVGSPQDPSRAVIGIAPREVLVSAESPVAVRLDTSDVGGPSAGLAFTLAVIDRLTRGELTGGRRVAATGTIALDGTVGRVGGTVQKAVAVRDAGYEVFLVPADERAEIAGRVGDDVEVIGVATLQDALDALASLGGGFQAPQPPGVVSPG